MTTILGLGLPYFSLQSNFSLTTRLSLRDLSSAYTQQTLSPFLSLPSVLCFFFLYFFIFSSFDTLNLPLGPILFLLTSFHSFNISAPLTSLRNTRHNSEDPSLLSFVKPTQAFYNNLFPSFQHHLSSSLEILVSLTEPSFPPAPRLLPQDPNSSRKPTSPSCPSELPPSSNVQSGLVYLFIYYL